MFSQRGKLYKQYIQAGEKLVAIDPVNKNIDLIDNMDVQLSGGLFLGSVWQDKRHIRTHYVSNRW